MYTLLMPTVCKPSKHQAIYVLQCMHVCDIYFLFLCAVMNHDLKSRYWSMEATFSIQLA